MGNRMGLSSHRGRRRRAVDGEQLLALGAAAVAKAGGEACAKARRPMQEFAVPVTCTAFEVMPPTTRRQSCTLAALQMRLSDWFLR